MEDFPEINTFRMRSQVDPLRFHIGDGPIYIGMNDINEFPFFKGMMPFVERFIDEIVDKDIIYMYDVKRIMYSLTEWKIGIRHNHKTCKGRTFNCVNKVSI